MCLGYSKGVMNTTLVIAYIAFFGGMLYLLLIMPQRRRARAQERMLSELKTGDEVVTVGGLFGKVKAHEGEKVELEVAEGVTITVAARAVGQIIPPDEVLESDLKA